MGFFSFHNFSFSDPILLKFIWYLTMNRVQVEIEIERYASIWPRGTAPDRHEQLHFLLFPLNNLSLNEWISLKFMWYFTINKIPVGYEKGGYVSI